MFKRTLAAVALLGLVASPAFASQCPKDMAEIDAYLAKNTNIAAATLAEVTKLRAEGETLHKAGKHAESVKALHQAKQDLGM